MRILSRIFLPFLLAQAAAGKYFPPTPQGVKVVESKLQEGVKISYKEVRQSTLFPPGLYALGFID